MAKYKLVYFHGGRGEITRMMFVQAGLYGGADFEDKRVTREEWASMKESAPLKELPILEVDGATLVQSHAIERFVANELGFAGDSRMERAMVDSVTTTMSEAMEIIAQFHFIEKDPARIEQIKTKAMKEDFPRMLSFVESVLKANDSGQGVLIGSKITIADIATQHILFVLALPTFGGSEVVKQFPALEALRQRVEAQPNLSTYLTQRNAAAASAAAASAGKTE